MTSLQRFHETPQLPQPDGLWWWLFKCTSGLKQMFHALSQFNSLTRNTKCKRGTINKVSVSEKFSCVSVNFNCILMIVAKMNVSKDRAKVNKSHRYQSIILVCGITRKMLGDNNWILSREWSENKTQGVLGPATGPGRVPSCWSVSYNINTNIMSRCPIKLLFASNRNVQSNVQMQMSLMTENISQP